MVISALLNLFKSRPSENILRVSQDVFIHKPDVYVAYNFIHRIKNESNRPTNVVGGNVCRRNVRCAECDSIW